MTASKYDLCKTLVDAWLSSKGAPMWRVWSSFKADHHKENLNDEDIEKLIGVDFVQGSMDVFGFMCKFYPKINSYLLTTKKGDSARVQKIVDVFSATHPVALSSSDKKYYQEAYNKAKSSATAERANSQAYSIEVNKTRRGKRNWNVVS